ncbi:hypothetical protein U1Q18_051682, partial [Sarracenia purpurea var. burkii]
MKITRNSERRDARRLTKCVEKFVLGVLRLARECRIVFDKFGTVLPRRGSFTSYRRDEDIKFPTLFELRSDSDDDHVTYCGNVDGKDDRLLKIARYVASTGQ